MKLELHVRRTRSSIRSDVNTGSRTRTQSGGCGYGTQAPGLPPAPPPPPSVAIAAVSGGNAAY